jgi:cellulose 1,4-beta-cellobiosidase
MAQLPGKQKDNLHPKLSWQECTSSGCTTQPGEIVLDSNWMWTHTVTGKGGAPNSYTNCYEGTKWDPKYCPDGKTCAENCALDGGDYPTTYGVTTEGSALTIKYVTKSNVGARTYLMEDESNYKMFKLKNRAFSFDVELSTLPCGLNGALYFVEMDQDGGMSKFPGNKAGAKYGTGYCDAQCPHDIKFISGEANIKNWNDTTAMGAYGSCCTEMDIWEANSEATQWTPHTCTGEGGQRCEDAVSCGDGANRFGPGNICDKNGADFNPFRLGHTDFYGPGSQYTIDTQKPITVITEFHTTDGTDSGDLSEIRRKYVQGGTTIGTESVTLGGKTFDSLTTSSIDTMKKAFGDTHNDFDKKGGMKKLGEALDRGMVLVMSLWDDSAVSMLWLDGKSYPQGATGPGVARGRCSDDTGKPAPTREKYGTTAKVTYSNIKVSQLGSSPPTPPTPTPPTPPAPPAPPSPSGCPGGSLSACIGLCPSNPPAVYKACVNSCAARCPGSSLRKATMPFIVSQPN